MQVWEAYVESIHVAPIIVYTLEHEDMQSLCIYIKQTTHNTEQHNTTSPLLDIMFSSRTCTSYTCRVIAISVI